MVARRVVGVLVAARTNLLSLLLEQRQDFMLVLQNNIQTFLVLLDGALILHDNLLGVLDGVLVVFDCILVGQDGLLVFKNMLLIR